MIDKLKKYDWLFKWIGGILIAIITATWFVSTKYNDFNKQSDELVELVKTTQQMALKSVIWNGEIPLTERASACDVYLAAGYNSMTKRECEVIIDKASQNGIIGMEVANNVETNFGFNRSDACKYLSWSFASSN